MTGPVVMFTTVAALAMLCMYYKGTTGPTGFTSPQDFVQPRGQAVTVGLIPHAVRNFDSFRTSLQPMASSMV